MPEVAGRAYAASHPVRLLRLPISLEPLEIALYTRPDRARGPAQRWLVEFVGHVLTNLPARDGHPIVRRRASRPARG